MAIAEPQLSLPPHVVRHVRRHKAWRLARVVMILLVGLGLAILFFMAVHISDDQRAHTAAQQFVQAIQQGDADKAYAMGGPAFRQATTEAQLKQMFEQVRPFMNGARIEETDSYYAVSDRGEPRTIIVYTATKGQKPTYIRLVMDRQKGIWKVHSVLTNNQPLQAKPE
jgi:hypothetical protein